MAFVAVPNQANQLYEYLVGNIHTDCPPYEGQYGGGRYGVSLLTQRYFYLLELDSKHSLKISLHDLETNSWTKWNPFPEGLLQFEQGWQGRDGSAGLTPAIDVHRNILSNEIVVESDYPTYEENYEAARFIGKMIESKGFVPHYYFSGNKSIHVHVFFDWDCLNQGDDLVKLQISTHYGKSFPKFSKDFILWLRELMVSSWGTQAREFDRDLIKAAHLIRCEGSRNKLGFKTFLGYSHKAIPMVPYLCNEQNKIYPRIGTIKYSSPPGAAALLSEFWKAQQAKSRKLRKYSTNQSALDSFESKTMILRDSVKGILSDAFKSQGDGLKRGFFILINELKHVYGTEEARKIITDWNARMGNPVTPQDIEYRLNSKTYTLTNAYIEEFLASLSAPKKRNGNI